MQAVPMVIQTPAPPRATYRRRYRPRRRYRRRKLSRALRTFRNARRKYPASEYGYTFVPRTESTAAAFGPSYREASEAQRMDRINSRYYGRGVYTGQGSFWKKAARYAWKHRRGILKGASTLGVPGAAALSKLTGAGTYTGQGNYEGENGLFQSETADVPIVESSGTEEGTIKISHREYLTDLYGIHFDLISTNPDVFKPETPMQKYVYQLNPGLETTFPWLSQIAQNFEEYELEQCIFSFRSTLQEVSSSNGQVGTIVMATQYNPDTPDFRDKNEMMMYAHANSVKSTDDIMHGVECDDSKLSGTEEKYIRSGPLDTGTQKKDYDHGKFTVAVCNTPHAFSDESIGELWISYTVTLRKPKIFTSRGLGGTQFFATGSNDTGIPSQSIYTEEMPFLQSPNHLVYAKKNTLNIKVDYVGDELVDPSDAYKGRLAFILPAAFAGSLRMRLKLRMQLASNQRVMLFEPQLIGNITGIHDITWGAVGTGGTNSSDDHLRDPPHWFASTILNEPTNITVTHGDWLIAEAHMQVQPSNNAIDNMIVFGDNNTLKVWNTLNTLAVTGNNFIKIEAMEISFEEYNTNLLPTFYNARAAVPEVVDMFGVTTDYPN